MMKFSKIFLHLIQNTILGDARAPLKRLALLSDSTIDDIKRSKDAWNNAQNAIKPAKALFDIIAGSRIKGL